MTPDSIVQLDLRPDPPSPYWWDDDFAWEDTDEEDTE